MMARIIFINDCGIATPPNPVDVKFIPEPGNIMTPTEHCALSVPESVVLKVFLMEIPESFEMPQDVLDNMYGPSGYDGLPIIIAKTPDGWEPGPPMLQ